MTTIKTREPSQAFLSQFASSDSTRSAKKRRTWREVSEPLETTSKLTTNHQQTYNKVEPEPTTNLQQTHNSATETYNKLPSQPTTQSPTNLQQSHNKLTARPSFLSLVGLQRRILIYIYELCRILGSKKTEPVTIKYIAHTCETTDRSAQETLRRLEKKLFIRRSEFKNGRGGWTIYELPDEVYGELFTLESSNKLPTKSQQTTHKLPSQPTTEPTTTPLSSSSINSNYIPTTTSGPEWPIEDLDYSMLADIGFGRSQATQLRSLGIPFEILQRSLVYFDFELRYTHSGKTIREPLGLFMKRMRQNGCWEPPEEYQKRIEHFQNEFRDREKQLHPVLIPEASTPPEEGFSA